MSYLRAYISVSPEIRSTAASVVINTTFVFLLQTVEIDTCTYSELTYFDLLETRCGVIVRTRYCI